MTVSYQKAYFLLSAANITQLPPDRGLEVALVGRSNAGKSSVLNCITQNKSLARVSKTPGRTQLINVFILDDKRRMIDLPGYGYAKVPLAMKAKWQQLIDTYIQTRTSLTGLVLVMDIRHPFKELDLQLLDYCEHRQLPVHLLLNKADKLSRHEIAETKRLVIATLTRYHNSVTFQIFSATKGDGLRELLTHLDSWYR